MMFERFTKRARTVVIVAQEHARSLGHSEIGAEDLLLGILVEGEGVGARVLRGLGVEEQALRAAVEREHSGDAEALGALGIDLDAVRQRVEESFGPGALDRSPRRRGGLFQRTKSGGHLRLTDESRQSLVTALREAHGLHHDFLGTEHLLLGLTAGGNGTANRVLSRVGVVVDQAALRRLVLAEIDRAA